MYYCPVMESDNGAMNEASTFSFDVVSKFDFQEMKNAIDQAQREIHQRYDLKDTGTEIALTEKD